MKRILSIILSVAMLASMVSMTVYGVGEYEDQITTKNVMLITPDKDSYAAGDTVVITATMESIWGDPTIEDDIEGWEGDIMAGAYGMNIICANLIYDTSVFTAQKHTLLYEDSDILNVDASVTENCNTVKEAEANGAYYMSIISDIYNADGDEWGFFNGSGDLWQWKFTIAEDAKPGTYYLPVGPYRICRDGDPGSIPDIIFGDEGLNDRVWTWNGNTDSLLIDREIEYKTNYNGPSRVAENSPKGAEYECGYVEIVIKGEENPEDIAAAAEVDALIDAIGTPVMEDVLLVDAINHDGIYTHIANVSGSNFTVSFDMIPNGAGETYGFLGGVTSMDSNNDARLFWNGAEKKFQIAKTNNWMNSESVTEVLAESEVMDLPLGSWTHVEFVYAGEDLSIKVNGETVCSATCETVPYQFYIFYPSKVSAYMQNAKVTGDFGSDDMHQYFTNAAYITGDVVKVEEIQAASAAYEALNDNAKSFVTKKAELDAAVAALDAYVAAVNQAAADEAIALIDAIGTVSYPGSGDAIVAAENCVGKLTETQLALVTNYDTLTAARAEYNRREGLYNQAKADYVIGLIDEIGDVTFESRAAIELAESEYAKLIDAQKALVSNYDTLTAAREAYNLYAPVMNAENLITALGTEFLQGNYKFRSFTSGNGYCDLGSTGDITFTTKFVYTSYNGNGADDSCIAVFRNGASYVGYNFKMGAFVIANNGGWQNGSHGPSEDGIIAKADYELTAGKVYTMEIAFSGSTATITLDGEVVLTGTPADTNWAYAIFYPQNCDVYFAELKTNGNDLSNDANGPWAGSGSPLGTAGIDVLSPVDFGAKLAAAEAAVAALTDEQAALLADSYKDALAAAKADIEAKVAELEAAADAVEAKIASIASDDDIAAAQAAYEALLPGAKTLVENYSDLQNANALIVKNTIAALGTITPASVDAIVAAENAYNALTDAEKALVDNYATLTAARAEYNDMMAAVANAEAAIDMLQAGGSAIKLNYVDDGVGAYSQIANNPNTAAFSFGFDLYIDSLKNEEVAFIGGATSDDIFAGYDAIGERFVIADRGVFDGGAMNDEKIIASADYALDLDTWYTIEFVYGTNTLTINVDGETVVTANISRGGTWYIFYPRWVECYFDNVIINSPAGSEKVANFTENHTTNWTAQDGRAYTVVSDAPASAVKTYADLVSAARAAYDAVPEKAQYAVSNYDLLVAAENPVDPDAEAKAAAAEVDALIEAIGEVTLDSEDAIVAARDAYDALSDTAKSYVTKLDVLAAAEMALGDIWDCIADAADVDYLIEAIGEVTLDSEDAIVAARDAYEALSDTAKSYVTKLDVLEAAEIDLAYLKQEAAVVTGVQDAIDALDVPATNLNNYADVLAAEDDLANAKAAYDALTDEQKANVDTTALDAALAAYTKALYYNVALNGGVAPVISSLVGDEGSFTVTWDAVDNAVKYWVYVDGQIVATTTGEGYTVSASAGEHAVKVAVAINANAAIGSAATYVAGTSDEIYVDVDEPVVATLDVSATATENSITASWNAIDGAVYYVTFNIGGTEVVVKTTNTTITLAKFVTAATEYTVSVKALVAVDGGYEITESNVYEDITPSAAFQVTVDGNVVSWTEVDGATIYWAEITGASGKTTTTRYNAVSEITVPAGEFFNVKITAYAAGVYSVAEATIVAE